MKCQCPAPDYIKIGEGRFAETVYLRLGEQPVLHGKKADRECSTCGKGLCKDCEVVVGKAVSSRTFTSFRLCQACKED